MRLHFAPRTRSTRSRWLLEELEVPYELVRVDASKSSEVPVLIDGDATLTEPSAICLYLADRFPEKGLAPPIGSPDRGAYLQWLLFAEVTLEPLVLEHLPNAQRSEAQKRGPMQTRTRLESVLAVIDERLSTRAFLVGDSFTTADLVMAAILHLAHTLKLLDGFPLLFDYVIRQTKRPATMRAVSG